MNQIPPPLIVQIDSSQSAVVEQSLIYEVEPALRRANPDERWNCFDELLNLLRLAENISSSVKAHHSDNQERATHKGPEPIAKCDGEKNNQRSAGKQLRGPI